MTEAYVRALERLAEASRRELESVQVGGESLQSLSDALSDLRSCRAAYVEQRARAMAQVQW